MAVSAGIRVVRVANPQTVNAERAFVFALDIDVMARNTRRGSPR